MTNEFIDDANDELASTSDDLMPLDDFLRETLNQPNLSADSTRYLLNAIETAGTRTVIEGGEELERYCFFDDPWNDGEHAVLGNTRMLNSFVEDLRQLASDFGRENQMVWFGGPTATGKSELKRCIVNGLQAYSQTEEGRRYTYEWNIETRERNPSGYDSGGTLPAKTDDDSNWYRSPVQSNPLTVLPEEVREKYLNRIHDEHGIQLHIDEGVDPFSKEAYNALRQHYRRPDEANLFSKVTAPQHFRVSRYTMEVGQGIGVLHSEDSGSPKERLVGSWMPQMLGELDSKGRKNPQAFSYDGVLAQGNGGVTIVEDASQHADLLQKLLNIPEEGMVKLDNKISMDIDTTIIIISNPDLNETLNQKSSAGGSDPLKPLKRRLDKYELAYLTNLSLEVELLRRELLNERSVWTENNEERIPEPLELDDTEIAPHVMEAAALYSVVSRLDDDAPAGLNFVDKALLLDRGYHQDEDGERHERDEYDEHIGQQDRDQGIPVTYTRDILADLVQTQDSVLAIDALETMAENLHAEPMFSEKEAALYQNRLGEVKKYILREMEEDVIAAIMRDKRVDEEMLNEYVEQVFNWDNTDEEADELKMKVFEINHLGFEDEEHYDGTTAGDEVEEFRRTEVIERLGRYAWRNRADNEFSADDISLRETPVLGELLGSYEWEDVSSVYPNFDATQWSNPPSGTETELVKERCVENMQEVFDYTEESARQTSQYVIEHSDNLWD